MQEGVVFDLKKTSVTSKSPKIEKKKKPLYFKIINNITPQDKYKQI